MHVYIHMYMYVYIHVYMYGYAHIHVFPFVCLFPHVLTYVYWYFELWRIKTCEYHSNSRGICMGYLPGMHGVCVLV
jgi:hypothetical protein